MIRGGFFFPNDCKPKDEPPRDGDCSHIKRIDSANAQVTYTGRNIEATLAWARGLMTARRRLLLAKSRKEKQDARWWIENAWMRLREWARKEERDEC